MSFKEEVHGDTYVLFVKGKLMGGTETTEINDRMKELTRKGVRQVVLDLAHVKWMNSSGLGALMSGMTSMRHAGGDLRLSAVAEKVESVLMITQLLKIFKTYPNVQDAVRSFNEP